MTSISINTKFVLQNLIHLIKKADVTCSGPVRFNDVADFSTGTREETAKSLRELQDRFGCIDYNQHTGYSVYKTGMELADIGL